MDGERCGDRPGSRLCPCPPRRLCPRWGVRAGLCAASLGLLYLLAATPLTPAALLSRAAAWVRPAHPPQGWGLNHVDDLGVMISRDATHWTRRDCDPGRKLRPVSILTNVGNLTFYIYDSAGDDPSVTGRALRGHIFEHKEIGKFLELSAGLPLIDVGANVGLVTLQAAMQGRQVVAVEPVPENALRLCRSALDFGHAPRVHVVNNAVSSVEGEVSLSSGPRVRSTVFKVSRQRTPTTVNTFAIRLDRLLEVLPFRRAALKIDVESHEGHVIAGADRLFSEVDIPLVWMEWQHVKTKATFGAKGIMAFMRRHNMAPYNLKNGRRLKEDRYLEWPFTVLWRKAGSF